MLFNAETDAGHEHVCSPSGTTLALANELVRACQERAVEPTMRRIELMLYFATGWHLAIHGESLLSEFVYADADGPRIESLRQLGSARSDVLWDVSRQYDSDVGEFMTYSLPAGPDGESIKKFLRTCCKAFRKASVRHLEELSRISNGAWRAARVGVAYSESVVIHPEVMREHFFKVASDLSTANNAN